MSREDRDPLVVWCKGSGQARGQEKEKIKGH
jgi:hypothetical protein